MEKLHNPLEERVRLLEAHIVELTKLLTPKAKELNKETLSLGQIMSESEYPHSVHEFIRNSLKLLHLGRKLLYKGKEANIIARYPKDPKEIIEIEYVGSDVREYIDNSEFVACTELFL
jgi:hypothetical protein